jgi:hypothetical protein
MRRQHPAEGRRSVFYPSSPVGAFLVERRFPLFLKGELNLPSMRAADQSKN